MYDIAIIGAGVIGTTIARALSKYELNIVMVEQENDVACGATKANSAIIHAGYDAPYDTLMGEMNARGNLLYDQYCEALGIPFKRIGSLVIAFDEKDMTTLMNLLENGKKLNIPGLEIITPEAVYNMEPNLRKGVKGALYAPTAGIIEPWEIAIACAENAVDNGVRLLLNFEVTSIRKSEERFIIHSDHRHIESKHIINCAGVHADEIYAMVTEEPEFSIHPRRGQYFLLDKRVGNLVERIIFPCPTELGKGVLVLPTIHGNLLVGPDSQNLEADEKNSVETTSDRLLYIKSAASKLCTAIPFEMGITAFSGLRAIATSGDFIIEVSPQVENFINVAGIKSPGLSSAPAIAERVEGIVKSVYGDLALKENYNPIRRSIVKFESLSDKEKMALIETNPLYGRVVCRCENITEGEIIDAIHRTVGAKTLNGVKRRVRPGSGRCQGGFCGPRVLAILARELSVDPAEIQQESKDSQILVCKTKKKD